MAFIQYLNFNGANLPLPDSYRFINGCSGGGYHRRNRGRNNTEGCSKAGSGNHLRVFFCVCRMAKKTVGIFQTG